MKYNYASELGFRFTNKDGEMAYLSYKSIKGTKISNIKIVDLFRTFTEEKVLKQIVVIVAKHFKDQLGWFFDNPVKIELFNTVSKSVTIEGDIYGHEYDDWFSATATLTSYPFGRFDFDAQAEKGLGGKISDSECSTDVVSKETNLVKPRMLKNLGKWDDGCGDKGDFYIKGDFKPLPVDDTLVVFHDVTKIYKTVVKK